MNDSIVKQVVEALTPVAQKIGEGGQALFTIYTRQEIITGFTEIVSALFVIIVASATSLWAANIYRRMKKNKDDFTDNPTPIFMWLVSVVVVFIFCFTLVDGIQHLLNPQYFALKDIACSVNQNSCQSQ